MRHDAIGTEEIPLLAGEHGSSLQDASRRQYFDGDLIYNNNNNDDDDDSDSSSIAHRGHNTERDVLSGTKTVRNITWSSAYILIISRMIGSGIFANPGTIARLSGSVGLSLFVWIFGAGIAACGLIVSLELGCMLPQSGGDKVYLEFIYRRPRFLVSTMVAIKAAIHGLTAGNCIVFSQYFLSGLGIEQTEFARKLAAVGLLIFVVVIHGCFPETGILIQNALGWFKIGLMSFMVVTALVVTGFPRSPPRVTESIPTYSSWDSLWEGSNWGWGTLSLAIFKVYISYGGYDNVNYVMNEVKDPVRTLKTVAPMALASVCVLYVLVNSAYFVIIPFDEIKEGGELVAGIFFNKLFGSVFGGAVLPLLISFSVAGNVMASSFSLCRLNQEIARQGFLPFSHIISSSRPFNASLGGLTVLFIPNFFIIVVPPPGDMYSFILNAEAYPTQLFALAIACGLLWLRWTQPKLQRPFKSWLPAVWLRVIACIALVAAPFVPPKGDVKREFGLWYGTYALVGAGVYAIGAVYWYMWAVVMPRWRGYHLEEVAGVLPDGTSIKSIIKVKGQ